MGEIYLCYLRLKLIGIVKMADKYDWSSFAVNQGEDLKVKEKKPEQVDIEAVDHFIAQQGQTLRDLYHYEDPELQVEQKIQREAKQELREVQRFMNELGQSVDTSRSDWFLYLDPATKEEFLKKTKQLNEMNERLDQQQERLSRKEQKNQAQPGFKAKSKFERDEELSMRLKQVLGAVNSIATRMNPDFNPRPGTAPGPGM